MTAPAKDQDHLQSSDDLDTQLAAALSRKELFAEESEVRIDRFVVESRAGAGAMGAVYAARDPKLDRTVAIKLLPRGVSESGKKRFERESTAMAKLSHPNVATVHEIGSFKGQLYIVMEFVEGETLRAWVESRPRTWREIVDVYRQAGRGLAAAHSVEIVHRDFKPENAMVGEDGRVRVLDFGLARAFRSSATTEGISTEEGEPSLTHSHEETEAGKISGTPAYMPLEQHHGDGVDYRADQFAFCVSLYEALFGVRPYGGRTKTEIAMAIESGKPEPGEPPRGLPGPVEHAILRGLAAARDDRFASMSELLVELGRDPWRRRRQVLGGAALVAVTAGSVSGAWALSQQSCDAGAAQLEPVWNDALHQSVENSLANVDLAFAADMAPKVSEAIDGYADGWAQMHLEACEATRRGEQSQGLLDSRMSCLAGRLHALETLVGELATPDEGVATAALDAALGLPPLSTCADTTALTSWLQPPDDEQTRARVEEIRQTIAGASVQQDLGHYERAELEIQAASDEAAELAYRPVQAEAFHALASVQEQGGNYEAAEATLYDAITAAEAARHSDAMVGATVELVYLLGIRKGEGEAARRWARLSQGAIEALGSPPSLRAEIANALGASHSHDANLEDALAQFTEALALTEEVYGAEDPRLVGVLNNVGDALSKLARFEEAMPHLQRALAIARATYGDTHPDVASVLNTIGINRLGADRGKEALEPLLECLRIRRETLSANHPELIVVHNNLAGSYWSTQQFAEAETHVRRAIEIAEATYGRQSSQVAAGLDNLGLIVWGQGNVDESLQIAKEALEIRRKALREGHPDIATSMLNVGQTVLENGDTQEALALLQGALDIAEAEYGTRNANLINYLTALGDAKHSAKDRDRAAELWERAYVIGSAAEPPRPIDVGRTAFRLAKLRWSQAGARADAVTWATRATEAFTTAGDKDKLAEVDSWTREHLR